MGRKRSARTSPALRLDILADQGRHDAQHEADDPYDHGKVTADDEVAAEESAEVREEPPCPGEEGEHEGDEGDEEEDDEPEEGVYIEEGVLDGGEGVIDEEFPEELADQRNGIGVWTGNGCGIFDDDPRDERADKELHEGSLRLHQWEDIGGVLYKVINDLCFTEKGKFGKIEEMNEIL
jgi:hypothetical protein